MKLILSALLLTFTLSAHAEWKTETEAGLVVQSGNTNQSNTYAKTNWEKTAGKNVYKIFGTYINSSGEVVNPDTGETFDVRLAESMEAGVKYTRALNDKIGLYAGLLWERNRFAGFDERTSADVGLEYKVFKTETRYLTSEFGYKYRKEYEYLIGPEKGPDTESHFGRVYLEYGRQLSETSKFKFWTQALYDFSDSDNYEITFEPSVEVALGEFLSTEQPARISLSFAYKGIYDNKPAAEGLKKYDSIVTSSIKVLY